MKKLLLPGAVAVALFAASSQARAGISFSISLGHDHYRPPVVVAPTPVVVAPPVVAYPGHCAPVPLVAYPGYYAPAPRHYTYVQRGYVGCDRSCDHRSHGYGKSWHGHGHGLRVESPRGGFAMSTPYRY